MTQFTVLQAGNMKQVHEDLLSEYHCTGVLQMFANVFSKLSHVSPETCKIIPGATMAGEFRSSTATRDLKQWLKKIGLPYHSPHKFRHGNAVYSIKLAKDIAALKAVSQNLMHSNLSITDGVYGILSDSDIREQISALGQKTPFSDIKDIGLLNPLLKQMIEKAEENN